MKPVKTAVIIYLITIVCIYCMGYGLINLAHAGYDSFKVQCETLQGAGYVMVYVNDETYKILVVCK